MGRGRLRGPRRGYNTAGSYQYDGKKRRRCSVAPRLPPRQPPHTSGDGRCSAAAPPKPARHARPARVNGSADHSTSVARRRGGVFWKGYRLTCCPWRCRPGSSRHLRPQAACRSLCRSWPAPRPPPVGCCTRRARGLVSRRCDFANPMASCPFRLEPLRQVRNFWRYRMQITTFRPLHLGPEIDASHWLSDTIDYDVCTDYKPQ